MLLSIYLFSVLKEVNLSFQDYAYLPACIPSDQKNVLLKDDARSIIIKLYNIVHVERGAVRRTFGI